jgi:class 3 adenylate cyclase
VPACATCGRETDANANFCAGCGATLTLQAPPRESRKTVTIVFCDLSDSTTLGEQLDPEALRRLVARYFDGARTALERHGGTVEKFIGDAVMAVFGVPVVREDDSLRAVRAASEIQAAVRALNDELRGERGLEIAARIGVATGEVVAGDPGSGQAFVSGDAVNVAARLEQAAPPGVILISETTYRLVRDSVVAEPVEPQRLKGKSGAVRAWRPRPPPRLGDGGSVA